MLDSHTQKHVTLFGRLTHPSNHISHAQIRQWFVDANRSLRLRLPHDHAIAELRVYLNTLIDEIIPLAIIKAPTFRDDQMREQIKVLKAPRWHTHAVMICEKARLAWASVGRKPVDVGPSSALAAFTLEALNAVRQARGEPGLSLDRLAKVLRPNPA
jgi:hypothetical protein